MELVVKKIYFFIYKHIATTSTEIFSEQEKELVKLEFDKFLIEAEINLSEIIDWLTKETSNAMNCFILGFLSLYGIQT
jgi:hypothetical protein